MERSMLVQFNSYFNSFEEETGRGKVREGDREALVKEAGEIKTMSQKSKAERVSRAGQKCPMSNIQ